MLKKKNTKSVANLKESQLPPLFIPPTSSRIMQADSPSKGKKNRERTSIYSSPAGRYVTGPERCPANIKMHLFTLPALGPHQK